MNYRLMIRYLCACYVLFFSFSLSAEETEYKFERMWPKLDQPWYFFEPEEVSFDSSGNVYVADTDNNRIQKFTSDGTFITKWGSDGSGNGQFIYPSGVAIDTNDNVYVVDRINNRIQKFTSDGTFISKWGSYGSDDGQFFYPSGIAIDSSGNVYVTDTDNSRIQKFTSDGTFIRNWGSRGDGDGQFDRPHGIAIDSSNNVYVADTDNNRVQKFTSDGTFIRNWGSRGDGDGQFDRPHGIAIDSSDDVYVADSGNFRIQKFTSDGKFTKNWMNWGSNQIFYSGPMGIAIDSVDTIYLTEIMNNIKKYTPEGLLIAKWGSDGSDDGYFISPGDLAVDSSGNVYVADTDNNRIQKFTADGVFITKWGGYGHGDGQLMQPWNIALDSSDNTYVVDNAYVSKFRSNGVFLKKWGYLKHGFSAYPTGIAIDSTGNVYLTDFDNKRIMKFTSDGELVTKWGSAGSGDGQFDRPHDIAIDSLGNVYVADTDNNRIQKFTADGVFITKWGSRGSDNGQFYLPIDIAIDSSDNVYVSEDGNERIQKFTSEGKFITKWGKPGVNPGELNGPVGLAINSLGDVSVVDRINNTVQVFSQADQTNNGSNDSTVLPKAIIVAGGGNYQGNNLWNATQLCSNYAYRALTFQGYTKDEIYYLTSDTDLDLDGNGILDDVDGDATNANLETAITSWVKDASDLTLYITNHGGNKSFRMRETELLTAQELNSWLDQLQATSNTKVTLIYDACQSGSFLEELSKTPYDRIFISSASESQKAYFTSVGQISFSYYFWGNIFNGASLYDSFLLSKNAVEYSYSRQTPMLNANGNSTGNEDNDMNLIQDIYIGNGVASADDLPVIGSIPDETTLAGETQASIFADNVIDANGISRVWAVITPPDSGNFDPSDPVLTLPTVELSKTSGDRYEGSYNGFTTKGTYNIAVFARDGNGTLSLPKSTSFIQTIGDSIDPPASTINVKMKNLNVSDSIELNKTATFTLEAESEDADTLYYRFSVHPDYGTSGYDGLKWESMTDTEWVSINSIDYTFTKAGKYIVVAWISDTTENVNSNGIPIIGLSVDVAEDSCRTDVTGNVSSGDLKVNDTVFFKVNAKNSCDNSLYYRFSVHPGYGTSGYDGTKWTSMTDTEWVSTDTISYSFDDPGKYIVVVWVTNNPENVDSSQVPIIGWSVNIE